MKNLFITLFIVATILLFGLPLPAADLSQGFLNLPWGTKIVELPDLKLVGDKGPVSYYQNPNEQLTILDKPIPSPIYGFYEDLLFAVYTNVETYANFDSVYDYLTEKYGPPKTTLRVAANQNIETWKTGDVKIKLKQNKQNWSMKLAFYYMPIATKLNETEQEAYAESQRRLFPVEKDRRPQMVPFLKF